MLTRFAILHTPLLYHLIAHMRRVGDGLHHAKVVGLLHIRLAVDDFLAVMADCHLQAVAVQGDLRRPRGCRFEFYGIGEDVVRVYLKIGDDASEQFIRHSAISLCKEAVKGVCGGRAYQR